MNSDMRGRTWLIRLFLMAAALAASLYLQRAPQAEPVQATGHPSAAIERVGVGQATTTRIATNATILKVVDGDTVVAAIDGEAGEHKIRLLGINTPETVDPRKPVECFGKEASARAKALLTGARVRIDSDPEADDRDMYDRLLRILYMEDGRQYNKMMVEDGYAYAYLSFPLNARYKRELKEAERDARIAERGLWSPKTCNGVK